MHPSSFVRRTLLPLLATLAVGAGSGTAAAQSASGDAASPPPERELYVRSAALARDHFAVVIDVGVNELYFVKGDQILWSAPVGTGTGLRLEGDDDAWDFDTPNGTFNVQYKEEVPVWRAPDWYFIENGLPIPPQDSPKRLFPGGLGAAAVYIGEGLAIHGTNKPELLGERISHGCIRLSNADAQRLFHSVQIGTEVVIQGEPTKPVLQDSLRRKPSGWDDSKGPKRSKYWYSVEELPTDDLLARLEEELAIAPPDAPDRWTELAAILIDRAADDDEEALHGLLQAADAPRGERATEYATFMADLFKSLPLQVLDELASLRPRERSVVARAIVQATLELHPYAADAAGAPWPTGRIPRELVAERDLRGWEALREAEQDYRQERGIRLARGG